MYIIFYVIYIISYNIEYTFKNQAQIASHDFEKDSSHFRIYSQEADFVRGLMCTDTIQLQCCQPQVLTQSQMPL